MKKRILLVGNPRATHVGLHFMNGSAAAGVDAEVLDMEAGYSGPRLLRTVFWRCLGRRPLRLDRFSKEVAARCRESRPELVLCTGIAPVNAEAVAQIRSMGIPIVNFLTDDPWNPQHAAPWFMKALPKYDRVFTPRRANMDELRSLKGPGIHYLPFAYAPEVHFPPTPMSDEEMKRWQSDVLFIGGGDSDRSAVMLPLRNAGFKLDLWGGYWDRFDGLRDCARGHAGPDEFRKLVANAAINLCLVRKANRDGHSMRSFELPAVGGCLVVEDTAEHREIFGPHGDCVSYYSTEDSLASEIAVLLAQPEERIRRASAVRDRISVNGRHRYSDRLSTLISHSLS